MKNTFRQKNGKYDYSNMNLLCKCGHKLGVHAAQNETGKRPCFNEDLGMISCTGENCNCKNFYPIKIK